MDSILQIIQTFQNTAVDSIHRKIVGDNLPAKEFFHFLSNIAKHSVDFLVLCTVNGLILESCGNTVKRDLSGYTITLKEFCYENSPILSKPVTDKFLLLYITSPQSDFDYGKFATSLSHLIAISNKSRNLLDCFDFVDNTICIYDKEAFLLYANKSYCEHFNITNREDALGMHIYNITSNAGIRIKATKTRSNNLKMMDVLKNGKKVLDWEIQINPNDLPGNANSIINNMYPFKDEQGNIEGLIEISSMQNINLNQTKKILGMSSDYTFDSIIGKSAALVSVKEEAKEYAKSPYNLLIVGESGVGKEMFAQAVHNESPRRNGPFVAINCASLPDNLIESELFGYVGGAFTGASKNGQVGKFELADGGTLFLDEIGEMPIQFQPKLLRVLETQEVMRIGSTASKHIDVRVIAATNRNLSKMIDEGFFREDLYYRLQILNIVIPPLRKRREDILLLTNTFLARTASADLEEEKQLSREAEKALLEYDWPGNVRELRNVVYRLSLLSKGHLITRDEMEDAIQSRDYRLKNKEAFTETPQERLDKIRAEIDSSYKNLIQEALSITGGKKQKAADLLGIDRKTLYRMIKKYFQS